MFCFVFHLRVSLSSMTLANSWIWRRIRQKSEITSCITIPQFNCRQKCRRQWKHFMNYRFRQSVQLSFICCCWWRNLFLKPLSSQAEFSRNVYIWDCSMHRVCWDLQFSHFHLLSLLSPSRSFELFFCFHFTLLHATTICLLQLTLDCCCFIHFIAFNLMKLKKCTFCNCSFLRLFKSRFGWKQFEIEKINGFDSWCEMSHEFRPILIDQ